MASRPIAQLFHFISIIISGYFNRIKYSTFARLRILINILLLIVILIAILVLYHSVQSQVLRFLQDHGVSTIETTNEEIVNRLDEIILEPGTEMEEIISHPEFHRIVLNQFNQVSIVENFLGMALLDKNYKLPMVPVGDFNLKKIEDNIKNKETVTGKKISYQTKKVIIFMSPIKVAKQSKSEQFILMEKTSDEKQIIGYTVLLISLDSLEKGMRQWTWNIGFFALILIMITVYIHNRVFRVFLTPFQKLTRATALIAQENYSIRINSNRLDELGELSNSFDFMASRLEQNIGDLEEKHNQLQEAYKELEESKELIIKQEKLVSLGTMVAGIAHEINNPTQALKFSTESLKLDIEDINSIISEIRKIKFSDNKEESVKRVEHKLAEMDIDMLTEEMREIIEENHQSINRIEHIIKSTKRMAYADLQLTTCSINEIIDDAITLAYNQIKYNIKVQKDLDKNLPPIQASPQELGQVFINLIINAKDAILEKGLTIETAKLLIKTKSLKDKNTIVIEFIDNGCGIPRKIINKIFDPFFTTKNIGQGTGLGLNLCHRIIESHHGSIEVKSQMGEGTAFIITFPVQREKDLLDIKDS